MPVYQYPRPAVTVDVVALNWEPKTNVVKVLLITRNTEPYKDHQALPGGHVDAGEDGFGELIRSAAVRELREETGIVVAESDLNFLGCYDQPRRDPRGWYISHVFWVDLGHEPEVMAGDDARIACWVSVDSLDFDHLAFDHKDMLSRAVTAFVCKKAVQMKHKGECSDCCRS